MTIYHHQRRQRQRRGVLVVVVVVAVAVLLFLQQQPQHAAVESLSSSSSLSSSFSKKKKENNMIRSSSNNNVKLRVVSYNVLSSHLASPSHFTTLNPDHLEAKKRLPMVLHKLQHEITNSNNKQKDGNTIVICCLQEVSYDWAGELHTFFANHGYHMVTGLYGKWYSGYMGVALAWPTDQLEVLNVDISRLSETRPGGWPKKLSSSTSTQQQSVVGTIVSSVLSRVQSLWTGSIQTLTLLTQKVGLLKAAEVEEVEVPPDHWTLSASRNNVLLTATLKDKTTGNIFCCANYHMPCAYYCPMAMTIHADLCAAHVQRLATIVKKKSSETTTTNDDDENDNNDNQQQQQQQPKRKEFYPYVLAGDFNIKPNEPVYRLLTTGQMDAQTDATFYPTSTTTTTTTTNSSNTNAAAADGQQVVERVVEWTPSMQHAMKSAYAEHNKDNGNKKEPDFTNYARIKEQEPFIDTLDYIFYGPPPSSLESASASWKVTDVAALPDRKDAGGPFPNLDKNEPSDHLLIAATLEMQ